MPFRVEIIGFRGTKARISELSRNMDRVEPLKRILAAASAVGTILFIGLFGWLFLTGLLPGELFALLTISNIIVLYYSIKIYDNEDDTL